jgi:hypothetical protein
MSGRRSSGWIRTSYSASEGRTHKGSHSARILLDWVAEGSVQVVRPRLSRRTGYGDKTASEGEGMVKYTSDFRSWSSTLTEEHTADYH